jgi:hypothetical protein
MQIILTRLQHIDIAPVLDVLAQQLGPVRAWALEGLECTDADAQAISEKVQASPQRRIALASTQMQSIALTLGQIIEGTFVAFSDAEKATAFVNGTTDARACVENGHAVFAVVVRDGEILELLTASGMNDLILREHLIGALGEVNRSRLNSPSDNRQNTTHVPLPIEIAELDVVRVIEDLPQWGLMSGDIGAVVTRFAVPEEVFDVEFVNPDGSTRCICRLTRDQFSKVSTRS